MKKYLRYIASYGTAFIITLIGLVWYMTYPNKVVLTVLLILSFLPILALVLNHILSKMYVAKINRTKVADMQGYMLSHRNEAKNAAGKLLKKLQALRRVTTLYTVIIWFMAACAAFCGGALYDFGSWIWYPMAFYAGSIFHVVYSRIPKKDPIELSNEALILHREEYPYIHKIASQAAKTMDCHGELTIILTFECNAGIVRDGNRYFLQLGAILLNVLSEEELYCICLHEFSHISKKNRSIDRENQYNSWISSVPNVPFSMTFLTKMLHAFDIRYMFNHMTYQYATSVVKEKQADLDMARHSDPAVAGSALLKTNYDNLFGWESGVCDEESDYVLKQPNQHYLKDHIEKFKNAIDARHDDWDAMLSREILPNNASHPILRMRLETLGVQKIETVEDKSSLEYKNEVQNALDLADKKLCEDKELYENTRKECYLDPLERIRKWEEDGCPILAETYADIISDLKRLGRHTEAEALCDRAIQELDANSSQHAYYMKGCALIHRYDKSGADYIFHAIENNQNYLEEGLNQIGSFYCMMGMEEELLDYRQRAQQFAQKNKDEYSETGFISPSDKLSRDDMPKDMLGDILTYIHSIDEDIIQNIYLVRKTINETFFTSAFVIHFYGGTDEQREEIMHKIFRYLDTYPKEWQFSLFDYFDCPKINFKKIEGSLVYSKSDDPKI